MSAPDDLIEGAGFYRLYMISLAKAGLAGGAPPRLQLRFLKVIEQFIRSPVTTEAAALVAPACEAGLEVFAASRRNARVLDRPEVRRLIAELNPSLLAALRLTASDERAA